VVAVEGGGSFVVPRSIGGEFGLAGVFGFSEAFDTRCDCFNSLEDSLLDVIRGEIVFCFAVVVSSSLTTYSSVFL
jgi:hypothetical protein